ncbi:MAG: hypothetical protein ACJ8FN_13015, partial [Sphingomicrobium sp.]
MLRRKYALLAAAAAGWASCALGQVPAGDHDAALFGVRESAVGLHLSPNGNLVSYIAPAQGGGTVAFIANVVSGETKPFLSSGKGGEKIRWCAFVTDQRLICRYTAILDNTGVLLSFGRLIAVNSDGSG